MTMMKLSYIKHGVCYLFAILLALLHLGCSSNENAHTTATTVVTPPPRQIIAIVAAPPATLVEASTPPDQFVGVDENKPLLIFHLPDGKTFRLGDVVPINFTVRNAKLRAEGGDFRIRYFVDDDEARWQDTSGPFGLSGWVPGNHTIRLELIGPDGWPYRNGNQNIVTREIVVEAK